MNLQNQPPVFVPAEHRAEIEKLPKAALMDMVWDFAARAVGREDDAPAIMGEIRATAEIVVTHREDARIVWVEERARVRAQFRNPT